MTREQARERALKFMYRSCPHDVGADFQSECQDCLATLILTERAEQAEEAAGLVKEECLIKRAIELRQAAKEE